MKKILIIGLLFWALSNASLVFAADKEILGVLKIPGTLRVCPETSCNIIRYYAETATVKLVGIDDKHLWYKVIGKGDSGENLEGWMHYSIFSGDFRDNFSTVVEIGSTNKYIIANNSSTFSFTKNEVVSCSPTGQWGDFISNAGTDARILYKLADSSGVWYRVVIDTIPTKNGPNNFAKRTTKEIETCTDSDSVTSNLESVIKLQFWIKENSVPENLRETVMDYESYAKQTLGKNSFYISNAKVVTGLLRKCPDITCPVEWIGGTPACGKGQTNSCGIATVIESQGDWYKVIVSNIDTSHFDVAGGDGWLQKTNVPDYAQEIEIVTTNTTQNRQPSVVDKNNWTVSVISFAKDYIVLPLLLLLLFIVVLYIIYRIGKYASGKNISLLIKKRQKTLGIIILLLVVAVGVGVGIRGYLLFVATKNKEMADLIIKQQNALAETNKTIAEIKNNATKETKLLEDKIDKIRPTIINNITKNEDGSDYSSTIAKWQDRVAKVICSWNNPDGSENEEASGSSILVNLTNYGIAAVTNKHVATNEQGFVADSCVVFIYGKGGRLVSHNTYSTRNPFFNGAGDWMYILLANSDEANDNSAFDQAVSTHLDVCTQPVKVGDKIIVLGYPGIGTQDGLTATEGIISGIENNYYVTSAKIDHGNSGGAAILLKDDCYLGIPTWVANNGGFESLGRILKSSYVLNN